MKIASKYFIATIISLFIVVSLAAFGDRQLSQSQTSAPIFSAYPLPATPTPRGKAPAGTPTRAAYPLPGQPPPPPPMTWTAVSTMFLPLIFKAVGSKGTAGIIWLRSDLGFTNEVTMGVQWGYNWNTVYSKTHDVYSSTFPYQVVNDVRSTFRASIPDTITSTPFITWNIGIQGDPCPGSHGFDQATGVEDPTKAGQAALQACVADIAHSRPGQYWLIWNEPDLFGTDNDGISPTLGARYFRQISDTILTADPTAKLIVGNVGTEYTPNPMTGCGPQGTGCGVYWLTQFISAYTVTYGIDPRSAIAGYGIHAYSIGDKSGLGFAPCGATVYTGTDECYLSHFAATVQAGIDWVSANDPGKELWATETNWQYGILGDAWYTQTNRMQQICTYLATQPIQRYGWFYGLYPYITSATKLITVSLYSADLSGQYPYYTGTLSPAGQTFIGC